MLSAATAHATTPDLSVMEHRQAHDTAMPAVDATHQLELQRLMRDAPSRRAAHQAATQRAASCREEETECTPPTTDDETKYVSKALPCAPPPSAKRALSQPVIGSRTDEEILLKIFCLVRARTSHPH